MAVNPVGAAGALLLPLPQLPTVRSPLLGLLPEPTLVELPDEIVLLTPERELLVMQPLLLVMRLTPTDPVEIVTLWI